ncbi:C2 family cysteine protease [Streptomyces sp. NBC_00513]|uniref:C2 family cysteine protease n=1 Tax=unclassified Streptomyces TaxID=2593676 RepID=UPI0022589279|nr:MULTISPECIES: C2 family cysteine protease [unclassified Streptomyces]MCX5072234.1 C2 family cysteine protease [Streptomyces sp. NBC_00424]MCX5157096.1 C2 family cysteine protease [Streptomyces sp. NBC_00291]WUD44410.1 C2 family cysteine protease [Streptomyces sp. NBC_00513]
MSEVRTADLGAGTDAPVVLPASGVGEGDDRSSEPMEPAEVPTGHPDRDVGVDEEPEVPMDLIPPDEPGQSDEAPEGPEEPEEFEEDGEADPTAATDQADGTEAPEEPQEPDSPGTWTGNGPEPLDDAADDETGERTSAADPAGGGPAPEGAPLRDVFSKMRDSLTAPHASADGAGDRHATVDRPAFNAMEIPEENVRLYQYGTPLDRSDGGRVPLFDGPPSREQTAQGTLGDCGVIASMGAVAGHLPEAISNCVKENDDGTYEVTLHQVSKNRPGDLAPYEPTGAVTVLTVTPELVVPSLDPKNPAYAQVGTGGAAWPVILEKAFAGVDQTWEEGKAGQTSGYERLNLGTRAEHRAEMLAQLTGRPAYCDDVPSRYDMNGVNPNRQLLDSFREKLEAGSPILIGSRGAEANKPGIRSDLIAEHVYEVVEVDDRGNIRLRNPHNRNHPGTFTAGEFRANFANRYSTLA